MNRRLLQVLAIGSMFAGDAASVICGVEDGGAGDGGGGGGETPAATATPAPAAAPAAPDPAKLTSEAQLALAKEAGFNSVEEMKAALATAKKPAPAAAAKKPEAKKPDGDPAKPAPAAAPAKPETPAAELSPEQLRAENERLSRKLADLTRQGKKASREAEEAKLRLSQVEAEHAIREAARKAGINDKGVGYALHLLRETLAPLTDEDAQKFNEDDFFAGLKDEHPYLFGVIEKPATTTTQGAGGTGSAPPKPESATEKHAAASQFNGLTASPADLEDYMRKNFPGVRVRN